MSRLTIEQRQALNEIYLRGDRFMARLVTAHLLLALGMATAYSTWTITLVVAPLAAAMFLGVRALLPGALLTRMTAGVALQTFCMLHIFQFHGLAEQHFWFFTSTTAMIVYQHAYAMWPGVLLIIAQHILFAALTNSGVQLYFFEQSYVGAIKLFFHFGIALVQTGLTSMIAVGLRRRTLREVELRTDLERARQAAERANHARGMFLANMSHEIRTPMNGIEGMADVLLRSDLSSDQRECAQTIRDSSHALVSVVGDVLDFSRIESGRLELEDVLIDPVELAVQVGKLLRTRAAESNVDLEVTWSTEALVRVGVDPVRLRQILLNLAGNGVKFARNGWVGLHVTLVDASGPAPQLEVAIEDDGIGIPRDKQQAIFEAFEQSDKSTTRRFGGTGLGLAITRRLVHLMGGALELESEEGHGSRFIVRVPTRVAGEPLAASVDKALEGRRIAVVGRRLATFVERELHRVGAEPADSAADADLCLLLPDGGERPSSAGVPLLRIAGTAPRPESEFDEARLPALSMPFGPSEFASALRGSLGLALKQIEPRAALHGHRFAGLCVLVVEDNPINQRVVGKMLELLECEVDFASDGVEAIEMLEGGPYAVVLMDCQMPRMNGYDATRRWREIESERGSSRLPILALTASAIDGERERCLAAGMQDCLTKPISLVALGEALGRAMAGGQEREAG